MRCKKCQYALWNLTSRVCPECGSPFAPSEFDFALNSVQFRCPHCAQAYYGTGLRGHLVPPEFDCVKCARHIHMDQMILLPTDGVAETQTRPEGSPWLERKERGLVRGWFTCVMWALFQPSRLMRATPPGSPTGPAVWFALLTNAVFLTLDLSIMAAWLMAITSSLGAGGGFSAIGVIVGLIGWFVGLTVLMGAWILVAHGLLLITGGTTSGIDRTAQAICYSSAANILSSVPCLGVYLSPVALVWWAISATVMTMTAQGVSGWRALVAVAGPPLMLIALLVGSIVWMIIGISTAVGSAQIMAGQQNAAALAMARPAETQRVLDALLAWGVEHGGQPPDHAARLVIEQRLPPEALIAGGSGTQAALVSVGDVPLDSLPGRPMDGASAVDVAAAALPARTIAYRLGDFVFTCPGVDLSNGDPGLWVVVCAPDQATAARIPGIVVAVGRLGGLVTPIASSDFARALAEQNELRAKYGLAPLPDPALVGEGVPAVDER